MSRTDIIFKPLQMCFIQCPNGVFSTSRHQKQGQVFEIRAIFQDFIVATMQAGDFARRSVDVFVFQTVNDLSLIHI